MDSGQLQALASRFDLLNQTVTRSAASLQSFVGAFARFDATITRLTAGIQTALQNLDNSIMAALQTMGQNAGTAITNSFNRTFHPRTGARPSTGSSPVPQTAPPPPPQSSWPKGFRPHWDSRLQQYGWRPEAGGGGGAHKLSASMIGLQAVFAGQGIGHAAQQGASGNIGGAISSLGSIAPVIGSAFGPLGTVVGMAVGGVISAFGGLVEAMQSLTKQTLTGEIALNSFAGKMIEVGNPVIYKELERTTRDLKAVIGQALTPIFRELRPAFRELADAIAGYSPQIRQMAQDLGRAFAEVMREMKPLIPLAVAAASAFATTVRITVKAVNSAADAATMGMWLKFLKPGLEAMLGAPGASTGAAGVHASAGSTDYSEIGREARLAALMAPTDQQQMVEEQKKTNTILAGMAGKAGSGMLGEAGRGLKFLGDKLVSQGGIVGAVGAGLGALGTSVNRWAGGLDAAAEAKVVGGLRGPEPTPPPDGMGPMPPRKGERGWTPQPFRPPDPGGRGPGTKKFVPPPAEPGEPKLDWFPLLGKPQPPATAERPGTGGRPDPIPENKRKNPFLEGRGEVVPNFGPGPAWLPLNPPRPQNLAPALPMEFGPPQTTKDAWGEVQRRKFPGGPPPVSIPKLPDFDPNRHHFGDWSQAQAIKERLEERNKGRLGPNEDSYSVDPSGKREGHDIETNASLMAKLNTLLQRLAHGQ